jgi:hypothetical protein
MTTEPPTISPELVRFLEETYPDRHPDHVVTSLDAVNFRAGQMSVDTFLRETLNDQQKGETEDTQSYIRV